MKFEAVTGTSVSTGLGGKLWIQNWNPEVCHYVYPRFTNFTFQTNCLTWRWYQLIFESQGCVRQTRSWVKNRWNKSSLSAVLSRHVPNCTMFIRNTKRCRDIAWEPECGFLQRHFRGGSWIFAASKLAVWQADSNTLPGVQVRHFVWRCQKNKWKVNVAGTTQPNTLGP
jgi:hypothetical protein